MKTKIWNKLTTHLEKSLWMSSHWSFTLQDFHFGVTIQSWKDNTTQYGVWKLPKFHIFLFCIMNLDFLGLNFFSFFCNMVRYWNAWKVGNWMFGLHVTTYFTYLLAHNFFDLVCSLTLLQKFIKYIFMKLFYSMAHYYESITSFWVWILSHESWQWAYGF